jgi:uncharacterized membrane protein YqaE (UPF0057 family)
MKKLNLIIVVLLAMVYSSCTVEKRQYMSGYHVEWHHKNKEIKGHSQAEAVEKASAIAEKAAEEVAVVESTESTVLPAIVTSTDFVAEKAASEKAEKLNFVQKAKHKALVKMAETVAPKATVKMAAKMKAENKSISASNDAASSSEPDMVLLIILAIFIPPLAVYLYEGDWTKRCTVNLILTLLCGIPGIIHALIVILE